MADVTQNNPVPLSPCTCRNRHVHVKCLLQMIRTRKSRKCPVCNTQFKGVYMSLQPQIHVKMTLYNFIPVGIGILLIILSTILWRMFDEIIVVEENRYLAQVCFVILLSLGCLVVFVWVCASFFIESYRLIEYTFEPVLNIGHVRYRDDPVVV